METKQYSIMNVLGSASNDKNVALMFIDYENSTSRTFRPVLFKINILHANYDWIATYNITSYLFIRLSFSR
jgi:hypothetical protein